MLQEGHEFHEVEEISNNQPLGWKTQRHFEFKELCGKLAFSKIRIALQNFTPRVVFLTLFSLYVLLELGTSLKATEEEIYVYTGWVEHSE